jgi:TRAP-type C4-dicarboxylate transport system substrate-binding protein
MRRHRRRPQDHTVNRPILITALVIAILVEGCGTTGGSRNNKAGAQSRETAQVLRIESTDAGSPEALYFAGRVTARSGGSLTVDIGQGYPSTTPANEPRLARDLRAGRVDFGILAARSWPAAGVPAFAALQAPFVLGSYDVARAAVAGPAGAALNDALETAGVVPLALAPTQLRRVLSVKALATRSDFQGARIRISDDPTSAAGVRALGAEPVQGMTSDEIIDALTRHRLDGVETSPISAVNLSYGHHASNITDYALYDRVYTLVASSTAWKQLPASRQAVIRAAAQDTVGFAGSLVERDTKDLAELCHWGVRVRPSTAAQLGALSDATASVRAALRADPATSTVLRMLEATAGAGPRQLPVPAACAGPSGQTAEKPAAAATIPEGTYVTTTTREEYRSRGEYSRDWTAPAYTWTTHLEGGKWSRTVNPRFTGQVTDLDSAGTYEIHGDQVTFQYIYPVTDVSETLRWSYYKGWLTLEVVDVSDLGARNIYTLHPWHKIG